LKSLIVGAAGQDGVLLAEFLGSMDYEIHALVRAESDIRAIPAGAVIHRGDASDAECVADLISTVQPAEIYNFAALSSVASSWKYPRATIDANLHGVLSILEAVRAAGSASYSPKVYQASSSEMFGQATQAPQNELTPFQPVSPYAVSKAAAHFLTQTYREAYGIFASCGILYNHESHLRPTRFVTRKITNAVAQIKLGKQDVLELGTLDVSRDWGYAGDYVEAMWLMLQQSDPDDYIVATGTSRALTDFVALAFQSVGITDWQERVRVDSTLSRPTEVAQLVGDPRKAQVELGWAPRTSFEEMVEKMVAHDLDNG
jgi:GDPmannose 4,6-dehydratase